MEQHTPGPWRYSTSEFEGEYCITGSNEHGGSVLPILGRTHNWPNNNLANARLIAAAPTTVARLKRLLDEAKCYQDDPHADNYHSLGKAILAADEHLAALKVPQ